MPRGGIRPGAGRPKGSKNKKRDIESETRKEAAKSSMTPMEYMLRIMRDESEPRDRRDKMAYWLLPYFHQKGAGDTGKKEERETKAKEACKGRFKPSKAPGFRVLK